MPQRTPFAVAATLACGSLLAFAGTAQALEARISGHLNRAVMFADDGERNEVFFVDNETSNTRFRFTGSEEILPGIQAGIVWEMEFLSQNSSDVAIDNRDADGFELEERHQDIYFQGAFGKFSIGQGAGAADGASEADLSGTVLVSDVGTQDIGGDIVFANDGVPTGIRIRDTYNANDFESRYDRVRYDTPPLGPVVLSTGYGNKGEADVYEFAARASTALPGVGKVAARLGYSNEGNGGDEAETIGGSVSFLSDVGANLTLAYTNLQDDGVDDTTLYGKLGYRVGKHAVSVDYGRTSRDDSPDVDHGSFYGAGYTFKPIGWAELYAGVKVHMAELETGDDPDSITIATAGTRIKF